jgi:hypothetical protein
MPAPVATRISALLVLGVIALTGCARRADQATPAEEPVVYGPEYSAKSGLHLPEETRRALGVTLVEVTERDVPQTIDISLHIYQISNGVASATAMLAVERAAPLRPGQKVELRTRGGRNFVGQLIERSEQLRSATGLTELLIDFPRSAIAGETGVTIPAKIVLNSVAPVLAIPAAALLQSSDGPSVYTVSGEHFVRTRVQIGSRGEDLIEIKDGLYSGDQVVLQPVLSLWMIELAAVKGGQACCVAPPKGK